MTPANQETGVQQSVLNAVMIGSYLLILSLLPPLLLHAMNLDTLTVMSDPMTLTPTQLCEERWKERLHFYDPLYHNLAATKVEPNNKKKLLLVHVGKTGGTTLTHSHFDSTDFHIQQLHVHALTQKMVNTFEIILISLRNPIDRLISAYYFNHPMVLNTSLTLEDMNRHPNISNYKFFTTFPTIKDYGNALFLEDDRGALARRGVAHLLMDACTYLGGTIDMLKKHKQVFIVNLETMLGDLNHVSKVLQWNHTFVEPKKSFNVHRHDGRRRILSMVTFMQLAGLLELNGENDLYGRLKAAFDVAD